MTSKTRHARGRAVAGLALGMLAGVVCAWLLTGTATSAWAALHRPAPQPDDAFALIASVAGLGICLWLGVGAALTAATVGTSRLARLAQAVTPRLIRRAVIVAVGVSIAASTSPAHAASSPPSVGQGIGIDPGWGRPAVSSTVRTTAAQPVVVRRGDTLWAITAATLPPTASTEQIARAWPGWFAANRSVIGPDPDLILPGQRLLPPTPRQTR